MDAHEVILLETQKELVKEVKVQYERRKQAYDKAGGDPKTMKGNLICYLPFEMLREAFGD